MFNKETVMQTLKCFPNQFPQMLEKRYPHVLKRIIEIWNSPEGEAYFADLLQPGRSGGRFDRDGFPDQVWQEIFQLSQLYQKQHSKPRR